MLRRASQTQRKGQKTLPPQFWKQLYMTAVREGPELRMAAKAVDTEQQALPQLGAHVVRILLGQGLLQMTLPRSHWAQNHLTSKPELTHMTLCVDCLRLSKARLIPDGWDKSAIDTLAHQWKPSSQLKNLWLSMSDGHTHYAWPFIAEVEGATAETVDGNPHACWEDVSEPGNDIVRKEVLEFTQPCDIPAQARDALTKTVSKARIIPHKVVMNTTGGQYERWKHVASKELHAILKTAWKEPTQELRSRYFAAKEKVVTQLLVFSLRPVTAEERATGLQTNMGKHAFAFKNSVTKDFECRTLLPTLTRIFFVCFWLFRRIPSMRLRALM